MPTLDFQCHHPWSHQFTLDARFSIDDAGVTALFGPSGAGKTSILLIIAGLVRPDEGRILVGDRVLLDTARKISLAPDQRGIGYVPQEHLLFPHLSVRDNLRFGQKRRPQRAIDFDKVVDVLELGELLSRSPATLSGGQRQRVALGRAILRGPDLLLMDEPLAALDAPLKDRILTYLERALRQWQIPTLFVSHDQADVRRFADAVIVLNHGKVVASGATAETLDRATISRSLDSAAAAGPVNLLRLDDVTRSGDHLVGRIGEQRLSFPGDAPPPASNGPLYIQFLPRDVMLSRGDVAGISARNHLHGRVREIVPPVRGRVFVAVDFGQTVWSEVTPDAVRELDLAVDSPVICHVKSTAISVLS